MTSSIVWNSLSQISARLQAQRDAQAAWGLQGTKSVYD